jgi:hypothetical protein
MAETVNISKMAEILSKNLFAEFLWQKMEPTNVNWPCEEKIAHKSLSHPSDIVFYYDEPYTQARTYINCDLKSYAKGSITTGAIRSAIENLARSVACAEKSDDFRAKFIHGNISPEIIGLLFVYNHDGEYDKDFNKLLDPVRSDTLDIPSKSKIVVLGPGEIYWLNNIYCELVHMRGDGILPPKEHCKFFYPHLVRRKNVQPEHARAATLEMLTSPWVILSYTDPQKQNSKGFIIFYKRSGMSVDEFLYLIDYLMHYQMLTEDTKVFIKILDPDTNAAALFRKATDQYKEEYEGGIEIKNKLDAIEFEQINNVRTKFSELELGMRNA